eukprot:CAMPEP_0118669122 /NCGR_PEP_ID=MMETSP0785-20121206/20724_1 /TAXON_ID=91992 /ORGANISM="Bolidomonas pacifica, Strain CCMP 1866" /LENGTH=137 /DNA_ID=CAMNT_0006563767 /DNA_START=541 /DNA_END=954 /DNA_ORIENTATION=-
MSTICDFSSTDESEETEVEVSLTEELLTTESLITSETKVLRLTLPTYHLNEPTIMASLNTVMRLGEMKGIGRLGRNDDIIDGRFERMLGMGRGDDLEVEMALGGLLMGLLMGLVLGLVMGLVMGDVGIVGRFQPISP